MKISIRELLKGEAASQKGMSIFCAGCGATSATKPLFKATAPFTGEFVTCRSCFDDGSAQKKSIWKG